jgi:hypothetical protein
VCSSDLIAMQHGLEPSESDPQFHQQMVYAVAMRTLEQFDRALGRVVYFNGRRRLRLVPHAFRAGNAFYHPEMRAVLFGYFRASKEAPAENLPEQTIFTCLSHDIVAHEVTHAIVDRLRPSFNVATNPHVRAFHEGFADIVAVFQRLSFRDLVQRGLQPYAIPCVNPCQAMPYQAVTANEKAAIKGWQEQEDGTPEHWKLHVADTQVVVGSYGVSTKMDRWNGISKRNPDRAQGGRFAGVVRAHVGPGDGGGRHNVPAHLQRQGVLVQPRICAQQRWPMDDDGELSHYHPSIRRHERGARQVAIRYFASPGASS